MSHSCSAVGSEMRWSPPGFSQENHAVTRNMHRLDPKRPPEMQDKRMVVILPDGLYEAWLDAPAANSMT